MSALDFRLERAVLISAPRETVFSFFTSPERFARWWGEGSSIVPAVGGAVGIRYPNGVVASGVVREIVPSERIAFSYGYDSGKPFGPGGSLVTIRLEDGPEGTWIMLTHDLPDAASRDAHVAGWRFQLAVFARVAADEAHAGLLARVDALFAAWNEHDAHEREQLLAYATEPEIEFLDSFACVSGQAELAAHIAAVHTHMPGVMLVRAGTPRRVHGTALVDFEGRTKEGQVLMRGTNVLELLPDGRIARVVGLPSNPA